MDLFRELFIEVEQIRRWQGRKTEMSGGPAKAIFYEAHLSFDVGLIELGRLALADHWSTYPDSHPCSIDDGFAQARFASTSLTIALTAEG
jgi:hypothetical protein